MATRRRPPPAATEPGRYPVPPPELVNGCIVEDWIDVDELADIDPNDALVVACGRWKRARAAWFEEHDIPRLEQCKVIPSRRPIFAPE